MTPTRDPVGRAHVHPVEVKRWAFMPVNRIRPVYWLPVVVMMVAIDYATGPHFQFPAVYTIPVFLAGWLSGPVAGLSLAVILPLTRLALMFGLWGQPWDGMTIVATATTRIGVSALMAVMAARLATHERALMGQVEVLNTLLHTCSYCRKIKGADDQWVPVETYISLHKDEFTAGLCPTCAQANFPEHFAPTVRS